MERVNYRNMHASGAFYRRATANFDRLEQQEYEPGRLFKDGGYSWPGDWEGRTLLAWTLLAQSTGRRPKYLEEVMGVLPSRLNGRGYFGPVHPPGEVDEQQLSGNSWYLRAICEYYLWNGDDRSLGLIHSVIDHLLLPARGSYADYPTLPEQRAIGGSAIGELQGKAGAWHLSTDVGCAFIMLDGASQAYEIVPKPELKALIAEMAAKLAEIDIVALSFQTHATLSALRGLLRHYETTGQRTLLEQAAQTFDLYLQRGMTDNYANYNWFGRPEWTEPCAVVDSLMISVALWHHTGKAAYLNAAHHIFYNGLGYGQRPNGGFGCDCCAGATGEMLHPQEGLFEAYWCCTMRGAEGLSQMIRSCYWVGNRGIEIPFFENSEAEIAVAGGEMTLRQTTSYPAKGETRLAVIASSVSGTVTLRLFLPAWTDAASLSLKVNGEMRDVSVQDGFAAVTGHFPQGTVIDYSFRIDLRKEKTFGFHTANGGFSYRHGPLMLGIDQPDGAVEIGAEEAAEPVESEEGTYRLSGSGRLLGPINDMIGKSFPEAAGNRKQVLFRERQ